MKKGLYFAAAIAAVGLLARLPHPAKDISRLEPVQLVYVYEEAGSLHIETDTGAHGVGGDLSEASESMRSRADGEIFLETAEFLLLDPKVTVTDAFYALLRPGCHVCFVEEPPDLPASVQYLSAHKPTITLRDLRANSALRGGDLP